MYILLILFFASLISIIVMIGRKLVLLKNGNGGVIEEKAELELPYLKELKYLTVQNVKKYGHQSLILTLRLYIISTNFLKDKYREVKIKVIEIKNRGKNSIIQSEKKEISKFLKVIGDYKRKIRAIKHRIKEEENL